MDLDLVRDFINTADLEAGTDDIAAPADLGAWLAGHGLLAPERRVTEKEHQRAVGVREALRRLAMVNAGVGADPESVALLEEVTARRPLHIRFKAGRLPVLSARDGVDGAMATLVGVVYSAMLDGTWPRLKVCSEHGCQWAYFDRSKNLSSRWCSMKVCGNRAKIRAYRERRRQTLKD